MITLEQILVWAIPAAIVAIGFVVGLVFEWIIMKSIKNFAKKTAVKWDDVIVKAFNHAFIIWITLGATTIATINAPFTPTVESLIIRVISGLASFMAVLVLARIVHGMITLANRSIDGMPTGTLIPNAARLIIMIVGVVFILADFGIEVTPIIGALGIGGLAAALAFKDTLENLFSGVQLLASRKVRPGDYINLSSGETGYVMDISWRETTIKDFNNNMIIIPNSHISNNIIINYNMPESQIYVEVICGVGYDSDLEQVEQLVKKIGKQVYKDALGHDLEKEPTFLYLEFGDSSITFKTKILVNEFGDRMSVRHPLIKAIHKEFKREGINIPFPITTVIMDK